MMNDPELDYNGLPPLGCEASPEPTELEHKIGWLCDCLARVAAGTEQAFNLSEALCSLQTEMSRRHARISRHQRDQLLRSLALAHTPILRLFDASRERPTAVQAVNAVAGLICWWAETDEARDTRHKHLFADFQAYARWLRNTCHNLCLLEDIDRRANQRRTEAVADILRRSAA
ncbi:hypothetical protein DXM27_06190 [Rhizobium rhizogenes]|uniref:Uncharacterized protein n=2 Tax=Rhizobium rhizogenes TaxID=359 RepID=A0AA88JR69_RHIRH|nr:hypothetical protein DXM27_06190 [Rhizobium rhizogenes]